MQQVKSGDTVHVHYAGKLKSGELFDSSEGREPLERGRLHVAGADQDSVVLLQLGKRVVDEQGVVLARSCRPGRLGGRCGKRQFAIDAETTERRAVGIEAAFGMGGRAGRENQRCDEQRRESEVQSHTDD